MSDAPAPAPLPSKPPRITTRPWWLPGVLLGTALAAVALLLTLRPSTDGPHRAVALVQLKPRNNLIGGTAGDFSEYRNRQRFLLKSRDLITQTLAEPAVASLDSVRGAENAVQSVEDALRVNVVTDDILEVSMTGNSPDDQRVIVDHLVKRYVDEATGFEQRERNEQRKKLEQLSESMRVEIEALEKNIELLVKANGTSGGPDGEFLTTLIRQRLTTAEEAHTRVSRELARLEAERAVLKRQADLKGAPANLDRDARLRHLATEIDIKKEEREPLRVERDALLRSMSIGSGANWDIERMRDDVRPQRGALDKVNAAVAQVRMADRVSGRAEMRGDVSASPTRTPAERRAVVGTAVVAAFGTGFVLATALSFIGLVFRVLRRHA